MCGWLHLLVTKQTYSHRLVGFSICGAGREWQAVKASRAQAERCKAQLPFVEQIRAVGVLNPGPEGRNEE